MYNHLCWAFTEFHPKIIDNASWQIAEYISSETIRNILPIHDLQTATLGPDAHTKPLTCMQPACNQPTASSQTLRATDLEIPIIEYYQNSYIFK